MPLVIKLLLVPSLIFLITLVGRRFGPTVAGWLSAFPIISGPILLAVTLEQGAAFGAQAAAHTLLAVVAIVVFSVSYARCAAARPRSVLLALSSALGTWLVAVAALQALDWPLWHRMLLVVGALLVAPILIGKPGITLPDAPTRPARSDLPWRMLAGALLTLAVTHGAQPLGARLSGLFAMFPVMGTVLVGFSHRAQGAEFAVNLLRGTIKGFYAFAVFCLLLALLLPTHPVWLAFSMATGAALVVQLAARRPG